MTRLEWVGGRLAAPMYITEGEPYRPDLVLWLESGSELIVGSAIVHPSESAAAVADALAQALRAPMAGPPRRPDRIRLADATLVDTVRAVVGAGVAIETGPTPELDAIVRLMGQSFSEEQGAPPSYLEAGRVSADTVARFFTCAARLYRAAPWKVLWDSQVFQIDIPELGIAGACASVIGALGQSFGVLIYDSVDAYRAMGAYADACAAGGEPPAGLGMRLLSLNFERGADLPKPMRQEIQSHRWEVAGPQAYPRVMFVDPDHSLRPLTEGNVRLVTLIAEALAQVIRAHGERLGCVPVEPITEEVAVHLDAQPCVVRVTAPHPQVPWESDDDADDGREGGAADALLRAFLGTCAARRGGGAHEAGGARDDWLDTAGFVCEAFLRYWTYDAGGRADTFTRAHVEEFLLEYFPRRVTADDATIERTPEILLTFFAWLQEEGAVSAPAGQSIARCINTKRELFLRHARDRSRFGPAKAFATAARERGVDITDAQQMQRFSLAYRAAVRQHPAGPPSPPRDTTTSTPAASLRPDRPPKERWTPGPGERAPDAKDPCPCGSGRRYRKCCLHR